MPLIGLATGSFSRSRPVAQPPWFVVSRIMGLPAAFLPEVALSTVVVALVLTVGIGTDRHVACAGPQGGAGAGGIF